MSQDDTSKIVNLQRKNCTCNQRDTGSKTGPSALSSNTNETKPVLLLSDTATKQIYKNIKQNNPFLLKISAYRGLIAISNTKFRQNLFSEEFTSITVRTSGHVWPWGYLSLKGVRKVSWLILARTLRSTSLHITCESTG